METVQLIFKILTNVLDILILTFIIYRILLMLKGNRVMTLFKGVMLLLAAYFVSGWLQLRTINFLLEQSWAVLAVGLIVIFQPEIRSLLQRLGEKSLSFDFLKDQQKPKAHMIDELVAAVEEASGNSVGMLVVLEGKTGLKEYRSTGTIVDATVTRELLGNIFFKNSPLHDGAMIIKGNRIAAAGCIMPLTQRMDIPSEFGTRHRAAIGIAEVSDCLAIVVSEETGHITVVRGNKLDSGVSGDELTDMINGFYHRRFLEKSDDEKLRTGEK